MRKPDSLNNNCISVRVRTHTQERIKQIAAAENKTQSNVIRAILESATERSQ